MRTTALSPAIGLPLPVRLAVAVVLGFGIALVALPRLAAAASPEPRPTVEPSPEPTARTEEATEPGASSTPPPTSDPTTATAPPTPTPTPTPDPTPTPTPAPTPKPPPPPQPPSTQSSMNLFVAGGFRFQDPNMSACTSTAVLSMLNFIAARGSGGEGFIWTPTLSGAVRDQILAWERVHDTLAGGRGSDPHGWRNALNNYGWGAATVWAGARVYEDMSYGSYAGAMRATVRALIRTGKPVGVLGWRGAHAQMITGYYGLVGDPFERDASGRYTNTFTVGGFYLTDPLRKVNIVNKAVSWEKLRTTTRYKLRFQRYYETDSRYDDPYTPGYLKSKKEWYGKFVLVLPLR